MSSNNSINRLGKYLLVFIIFYVSVPVSDLVFVKAIDDDSLLLRVLGFLVLLLPAITASMYLFKNKGSAE